MRRLSTSALWRSATWVGSLCLGAWAAAAISGPAGALPVVATAPTPALTPPHPGYSIATLDDQADPTFNQLLGINDSGVIAGYFGSGLAGHPNKGYVLAPPYGQGNYSNENFPGSAQTQVTAISNDGWTAGFWANQAGGNSGFVSYDGSFSPVIDPAAPPGPKRIDQVLSVNDNGDAVGFYNDAVGLPKGFERTSAGQFLPVLVPGASSTTATGINDHGDICGYFTPKGSKNSEGFIETHGHITVVNFPRGTDTQVLGINDADTLVGSYVNVRGITAGFSVTRPVNFPDFHRITVPGGTAMTVVNGLDDEGQLVGFYQSSPNSPVQGFLASPASYSFTTLDDHVDPTFNQLLGINDSGVIAGYFGSGLAGHPNKGYVLAPPYGQGNYSNENFPGSAQTQVTGISNTGETVGFWADGAGDNFGFINQAGHFTTVVDPHTPHHGIRTDQLLGVNSQGVAVGFFDANGTAHSFEYDVMNGTFMPIHVPGSTSTTATAISDDGTVVGFFTPKGSTSTEGFELVHGQMTEFSVPGGTDTQALGVNVDHQVVGSFVDASGNTDGFTATDVSGHPHFTIVNDPSAPTLTVINGINDHSQLVGFYQDSSGIFHGFLAG